MSEKTPEVTAAEITPLDIEMIFADLIRRIDDQIHAQASTYYAPELNYLEGRLARCLSTMILLHPRCEEEVAGILLEIRSIMLILLTMGYRCGKDNFPSFQFSDEAIEVMKRTPAFETILVRACITRQTFSQETIFEAEDKGEIHDLIGTAVAIYAKNNEPDQGTERDENYVC